MGRSVSVRGRGEMVSMSRRGAVNGRKVSVMVHSKTMGCLLKLLGFFV